MKLKFKRTTAIILAAALTCGTVVSGVNEQKKELQINPNYYNVRYLGAAPDDGVDDTSAINEAKIGTVYIPEGEYIVTETISIENCNLIGAGSDKTIITADIKDPLKPIINLGRTSALRGVTIRYKDGLVTGEETEFQRVGVYTAGELSWQRGSEMSDVVVQNTGTAFGSGLKLYEDKEQLFFSATLDKVKLIDFSFRGMDSRSGARTGNYYKDVLISSGKYRADSAIYFTGEESECAIDKLVIKDTVANMPVYMERMHNMSAKEIIFDNVYATYYPVMVWESSSAYIDKLTFDYTDTHFAENPLIQVGSVQYIRDMIQTLNSVHIGTLKLNSFNSANVKSIIERKANAANDFYFTVDEYTVKNSDYDWEDFPTSGENLIITKKGAIATEGETGERPEKALCPNYSRYYDTTLKKTVVWDGKEWK